MFGNIDDGSVWCPYSAKNSSIHPSIHPYIHTSASNRMCIGARMSFAFIFLVFAFPTSNHSFSFEMESAATTGTHRNAHTQQPRWATMSMNIYMTACSRTSKTNHKYEREERRVYYTIYVWRYLRDIHIYETRYTVLQWFKWERACILHRKLALWLNERRKKCNNNNKNEEEEETGEVEKKIESTRA